MFFFKRHWRLNPGLLLSAASPALYIILRPSRSLKSLNCPSLCRTCKSRFSVSECWVHSRRPPHRASVTALSLLMAWTPSCWPLPSKASLLIVPAGRGSTERLRAKQQCEACSWTRCTRLRDVCRKGEITGLGWVPSVEGTVSHFSPAPKYVFQV